MSDYQVDVVKSFREQVVYLLVQWFFGNYEDPVNSMPWSDGEYVWLVECREADEELQEVFGELVHQSLIDDAVKIIEQDGSEWVKLSDLKDMDKEAASDDKDDGGHER